MVTIPLAARTNLRAALTVQQRQHDETPSNFLTCQDRQNDSGLQVRKSNLASVPMIPWGNILLCLLASALCDVWLGPATAQQIEKPAALATSYTLPDPLVCADGTPVTDTHTWEQRRRPEVLALLAENVYGRFPEGRPRIEFRVSKQWRLENGSHCREVDMSIGSGANTLTARMLIFLPDLEQPVGCFAGLNFNGNHTTNTDPRISLPTSWVRNNEQFGVNDNRAKEKNRGAAASRWPVDTILDRGFAVVTMYYGDIDPDFDDGFQNGIQPFFYRPSQDRPDKSEWGSIGAWAWGLSRAMDYIESMPEIDGQRVAVIGHSRLGKTSLWAGANDPRFALVISNNSGCGGAAISRRKFGETVERINTVFPHWFCNRFVEFNDRENELPVDQHMLVAMMAPRSVYIASATEDQWADPIGEYESLVGASGVFELYGNPAIDRQPPKPDQPVRFGKIGYHLRSGKHDIQLYDWEQYLDFAETQFSGNNDSR